MGLLDKYKTWRENSRQKDLSRKLALIKNPKAIKEERSAAIDYFCSIEDMELAVSALLERFEYSIENGISDSREKDKAAEGIINFGSNAASQIKDHLKKTTRIAWPIKLLNKVADEKTVIETLKSLLNYDDVKFDQSLVDKNYDVLCYLRDYDLAEDAPKLSHFLDATDERVRFAAAEALIEQKHDKIPSLLEKFLSDKSVENTRIKRATIEAFANNDWTVQDVSKFSDGKIEERVLVTKKGKVQVLPN